LKLCTKWRVPEVKVREVNDRKLKASTGCTVTKLIAIRGRIKGEKRNPEAQRQGAILHPET
jgi:hypothetical protein